MGLGRWGGTPPYGAADDGAEDEDRDEGEGEAQREGPRQHVEPRRPIRRDEVEEELVERFAHAPGVAGGWGGNGVGVGWAKAHHAPVRPPRPVPVADDGLSPTLPDRRTGSGEGVGWVKPTGRRWRRGRVGFTHRTRAKHASDRDSPAVDYQ